RRSREHADHTDKGCQSLSSPAHPAHSSLRCSVHQTDWHGSGFAATEDSQRGTVRTSRISPDVVYPLVGSYVRWSDRKLSEGSPGCPEYNRGRSAKSYTPSGPADSSTYPSPAWWYT